MKNLWWAACLSCLLVAGCQRGTNQASKNANQQRQITKYGNTKVAAVPTADATRSSAPHQANVVAATDSITEGTPAPTDLQSQQSPTHQLDRNSSPNEVCRVFLDALRDGDRITAYHLLTETAQLETTRANLELESPGNPDSTIELLPVEFATNNQEIGQVKCLLSDPDSEAAPIRLAWLMRLEPNGWKISGMSIETGDNGEIELLSFESAHDLQRIQQSIESEPETTADVSHSDAVSRR